MTFSSPRTYAAARTQAQNVYRKLRVMFLGDSMTDDARGRLAFYVAVLASCGIQVELVGPYASAPAAGSFGLHQFDHAGVSGNTIAQMTARVAGHIATYTPDIIIKMGAANSITAGRTAVQCASDDSALLAAIVATGFPASRCMWVDTPPLSQYDAGHGTSWDLVRIDYSAALPGWVAANGVVGCYPGLLDGDMVAGDAHPNAGGYTKIGNAEAATFIATWGRNPGAALLVPRSTIVRPSTSAIIRLTGAYYVAVANHASNNMNPHMSFYAATWFKPSQNEAASAGIMSCFTTWPNGLFLLSLNGNINVYANGTGVASLTSNGFLTVGSWNRIVIVGDATKRTLQLYSNGRTWGKPVYVAAGWPFPASAIWRLGAVTATFDAALGQSVDLTICNGLTAGFRVPTIEDIQQDYYSSLLGTPTLPGISAHYKLNEGSGITCAADIGGGPNASVNGNNWQACALPTG